MREDRKNLQNSKSASRRSAQLHPEPSEKLSVDETHAYDATDLKRLFSLSPATVRSLTRAGHLRPVQRSGRLHYSFQDLLVLRTASALRAANISSQRINRTLQRMQDELPEGESLRQLSLRALGGQIAVRQGSLLWESETGQYVLGLDLNETSSPVRFVERPEPAALTSESADELYALAFALEDEQRETALQTYRRCLDCDAQFIDARINLGRLLHESGRHVEAEAVYRSAPRAESVIKFNLAVLLEDLNRIGEALVIYQEAISLDPYFADAHFNLARIYQLADEPKKSLRHLLAYRRLNEQQRV